MKCERCHKEAHPSYRTLCEDCWVDTHPSVTSGAERASVKRMKENGVMVPFEDKYRIKNLKEQR